AKEGVEPQSETVWRQADKYEVPRVCFVNKMDKLGADFFHTVNTIVDRLGATPIVMQLPIGAEDQFVGVVDLIEMKALVWAGDAKGDVSLGQSYETREIPEELQEQAEEYRTKLMEQAAEATDELMEKYLEDGDLTNEEIKDGAQLGLPRFLRLRLPQPRRAADPRRDRRLPPIADRRAPDARSQARRRVRGHAPRSRRERSVLRARVQDRCPPLLRDPHLHPG